jgi:hypothetical protein
MPYTPTPRPICRIFPIFALREPADLNYQQPEAIPPPDWATQW